MPMLKAERISRSGPKLSDAQTRNFEAIKYTRRPGEIAFYCPGCDWNASVTDVDEARGVPSGGPLRYLDGDALVTLGGRFGLVENTADL